MRSTSDRQSGSLLPSPIALTKARSTTGVAREDRGKLLSDLRPLIRILTAIAPPSLLGVLHPYAARFAPGGVTCRHTVRVIRARGSGAQAADLQQLEPEGLDPGQHPMERRLV